MIAPEYSLRDGNSIPAIGLGTFGLNEQSGIEAIVSGIADGYRLLDTAYNYGNEDVVGEAVRRSGIDRSDLMITTKLPGRHHGFDETIASLEESRRRLDVEWVDLYLIHWPNPRIDKFVDSWRAMIRLREKGLVRSIGVSNFTAPMIERLERETGVVPAVNQVELHPYFPQEELRAFHDEWDIRTECWSPLAKRSELLKEPVITALAEERASRRRRSCSAGTSSSKPCRSRSRRMPRADVRTSTCSRSTWRPRRSRPSRRSRAAGSGAPTPTRTRSSRLGPRAPTDIPPAGAS